MFVLPIWNINIYGKLTDFLLTHYSPFLKVARNSIDFPDVIIDSGGGLLVLRTRMLEEIRGTCRHGG
jgi:hypothetical protein